MWGEGPQIPSNSEGYGSQKGQECCLSGIGPVSSCLSFNSQSVLKVKFSKATC